MRVLVTDDGVEGTAKLREGECVGGCSVKDQEHLAIGLKDFADPCDEPTGPLVVAVGNIRLAVRLRERSPRRRTDRRGVIARKFEPLFRSRHRASLLAEFGFPGKPARSGAFFLEKGCLAGSAALPPAPARLILHFASPTLYVQPRSRKNKNRIGIGTPNNHSKI